MRRIPQAPASVRVRHADHQRLVDLLSRDGVSEWLEVVRPTRTQPLLAVRITPRDRDGLANHPWPLASYYPSTRAEEDAAEQARR